MKYFSLIILIFYSTAVFSQYEKEVIPPFNIKTVTFTQNGQNTIPFFILGDYFQFEFDDLYGNEANYYYEIVHCNYDWKPSDLSRAEYLIGFDNQRIQDYTNSYTTLQLYSHYKLTFPNKFTQGFLVTGNYMLKILNEDREVLFSRKFILYQNLVNVPLLVKRSRNLADINNKQNLDFTITSKNILFQSPIKNVNVLLVQNGQLQTAIKNIKPMYTVGNDLIYKYNNETQFWAGNEFLYFENKNIRAATNNVLRIDGSNGTYSSYLYTNATRANSPYTFFPDINGNFQVININSQRYDIESDYSWVYFSLSAPAFYDNKDIYINGMFNNYALTPENKMDFNKEKGVFEKAIMIKQGFVNYQYVIADATGKIDAENALDGNFYQTENTYSVIVYYRENGSRYDKVIGKGIATSVDITN